MITSETNIRIRMPHLYCANEKLWKLSILAVNSHGGRSSLHDLQVFFSHWETINVNLVVIVVYITHSLVTMKRFCGQFCCWTTNLFNEMKIYTFWCYVEEWDQLKRGIFELYNYNWMFKFQLSLSSYHLKYFGKIFNTTYFFASMNKRSYLTKFTASTHNFQFQYLICLIHTTRHKNSC